MGVKKKSRKKKATLLLLVTMTTEFVNSSKERKYDPKPNQALITVIIVTMVTIGTQLLLQWHVYV